ncbi:hypothetical protein RZS08_22455, partial [Arthrospira platensis SPKY1]|nr:hypothetical protein [Arthrospira platensis SPKY1]
MKQERLSETISAIGKAFKTGGNQPFALTGSNSVWYIAQGYIDVFTSGLENNQPQGSRNYFFTAGEGELLFGIEHGQQGNDRGLLAVPSPNTEIISL